MNLSLVSSSVAKKTWVSLSLFSLSLLSRKMGWRIIFSNLFPPFIVVHCACGVTHSVLTLSFFSFRAKLLFRFCTSFVERAGQETSSSVSCFLTSLPMSLENVWLLDSRMIRLTLTKKEGQFQDKKREREQEVPWNSTKQEYDSFHYRRIRGKIMSSLKVLFLLLFASDDEQSSDFIWSITFSKTGD